MARKNNKPRELLRMTRHGQRWRLVYPSEWGSAVVETDRSQVHACGEPAWQRIARSNPGSTETFDTRDMAVFLSVLAQDLERRKKLRAKKARK